MHFELETGRLAGLHYVSAVSAAAVRSCCMLLIVILTVLGVPAAAAATAGDPILEVMDGVQSKSFKRSELLRHPATREIVLTLDAAYHRPMRLQAIPVTALLPEVGMMESLQILALDGFAANIAGRLLAGEAQAYIGIEPAEQPWPALKSGSAASAGPYYLVWLKPEKAGISNEQWPYQIAKIALAAPLPQRYPQLLPALRNSASHSQELRGLQVYLSNCAVCHQLNGAGDASIGPDLNRPYSPTEYFHEQYLRQLIRNPAAVRSWKQSVMPGFSPQAIPDASLDDLIAYFKRMAQQRN